MNLLLHFYLNLLLTVAAGAEIPQTTQRATPPGNVCTVWVFLDPECPICQSYTLTLRQMHEKYASRGVTFRGLYASPVIKKRDIRDFHKTYKVPFPGETDRNYLHARRWNATVTPEVVVTSPIGEVLYRGAIDNWYYALGRNRPEPTEHYLKDALDAVLGGNPVVKKSTKAVGCLMNF